MNTQDQKLRVAPTSALVLSFVQELYTEGVGGRYMQQLDLSSVKDLSDTVARISEHFSSIAALRKKMVKHLFRQFATRYPRQQVCILAAGLDPLGLQVMEQYAPNVSGLYEIDQAWMSEKGSLYARIAPDLAAQIQLIQGDITNTIRLRQQLQEAGYDASQPTLVIFEGIIHYVSEEQFMEIMQCFRTRNRRNTVIMDYCLTEEEVSPAFKPVMRGLLDVFINTLKLDFHLYTRKKIQHLLYLLEAEVYNTYDMQAAEYLIDGSNRRFHQPGDGFLEMTAFHL